MQLLFPIIREASISFSLLSLSKMAKEKEIFQNSDALLTEFEDDLSENDIKEIKNPRILSLTYFNKLWFLFVEYADCIYLILDFNPCEEEKEGQII